MLLKLCLLVISWRTVHIIVIVIDFIIIFIEHGQHGGCFLKKCIEQGPSSCWLQQKLIQFHSFIINMTHPPLNDYYSMIMKSLCFAQLFHSVWNKIVSNLLSSESKAYSFLWKGVKVVAGSGKLFPISKKWDCFPWYFYMCCHLNVC